MDSLSVYCRLVWGDMSHMGPDQRHYWSKLQYSVYHVHSRFVYAKLKWRRKKSATSKKGNFSATCKYVGFGQKLIARPVSLLAKCSCNTTKKWGQWWECSWSCMECWSGEWWCGDEKNADDVGNCPIGMLIIFFSSWWWCGVVSSILLSSPKSKLLKHF